MNLDNEYNVAARYRTIRKHLDSLGYKQALSLDALPLIEKLLADLIQTTDSLKHFKAVAHDNVEACSRLQLAIDPYKCDNARLVQECNQLHLDLIEAKETHQKQIKDVKKKSYNLESECNDLQAASSRNLKRIKELETESTQKSKKLQELLGKCNKPLINNVALGSKKRPCYPLRRPSLEAEPMPRSKSVSALPSHRKLEPQVVDLIGMADRKINSLSHEVSGLKGELAGHIDSVYTLKSQLATKEKEISRLRKMLEGGRPYSAVSKDCSCRKIGQCCDHGDYEDASEVHCGCQKTASTGDSRILQKSKSDLEQQLREALKKQHDAMSQAMQLAERNEELEKELRDIDHIALAVEADCNSTVKENNKRVSQLQEKLESIMTQVHVLEGELMVERRSGQELRADLEGSRLESRNLQRKLESSLDEKKRMTDRINELTVIEQSLNEEIGRLARTNGNLKQEVARLDYANNLMKKQIIIIDNGQNVKEDLKSVKEKVEKNDKNKGKMLMKKKPASRDHRRSFSPPVHEKQRETTRKHSDARDDEVTRDSNIDATKNASQRFNADKSAKISQLQQAIDQVQTDRDFYKKEYNRLREQCMKNSEADNAELWGQVCELRRQLIDKEHAVLDLQREKKELCREKFELELRLQSVRTERRNAGHPCDQCRPINGCACSATAPLAGGDSKASSALMERLERERDMARADVDRLVEERDTLRERLKLAVEAHKFEQHRLRKSLCDVETPLKKLEREKQDLLVAQGTQRATINGFEDQLEDLREELRRTKQDLSTQRTQYLQLRTLQDQADQALGDVQGQLNHSESELYKAMDRNRHLEQQRTQLDNDVKELKQQINTMRANRSEADQEKDQLVMELEEKTGKIAALEREIKAKDQEASGAEQQLQELQHKNQLCVDQSAEQERRLRNMQMEMEIHQRQLAAASTDRDNAAQENRRLQDDLAAVSCEIRTLQRELEVSRAESYDLKRQLQTYVSEVRRAEDLINKKENERTEMLNHFRSLSLEATMLENNNHSLESEAAEARGALQAAQDRSLDLERQLTDRDCMIRGYEAQINELTQTVASLETQIRQQMDQRQRAETDLNAVRDLCVKLDQQKATLVKELGDKDTMKAQYEAQLARLKAEQNMTQDQINRDHVTVERLESLLDQARQESMDSQTANQELQCEISRLKQRSCELQNKLSSESAELRRYQNQSAEYSKQIAELRRQVTNERFDRARKEEEHRRSCLCGESGNLKRRETLTRGSSQEASQTRRLDSSIVNAPCAPSPRYPESGKMEEYRNRGDLRLEARRTNRFNASSTCKASTNTACKCAESNSKMYNDASVVRVGDEYHSINVKLNPDISVGRTDRLRMNTRTVECVSTDQAHQTYSNCGNLRVEATLEEDNTHKDIRVRISDASTCSNFDGIKDKTSVVKFSSPIMRNDAYRQPANEKIVHKREIIEYDKAEKNDQELIKKKFQTDDKTIRAANEVQPSSLSSKINTALRNLNCKTPKNRDEASEGAELKSLEFKPTTLSTDDDTSGYHTSETMQLPEYEDFSVDHTTDSSSDTLRSLARRIQLEQKRSRSVPREKFSNESNVLKSNPSGPIRVNYSSRAVLTADDLTQPEFIRYLTDIREKTQKVERQLAQMNNSLRNQNLGNDRINSTKVPSFHDKNIEACLDLCNSAPPVSHDKIPEKKIILSKKKNKNESSQSDLIQTPTFSLTPKILKTNETKLTKSDKILTKMEETKKSNISAVEETKTRDAEKQSSKVTKDQHNVTRNRIIIVGPKESSETQTKVTIAPSPRLTLVDQSTMFKPSKIPVSPKQTTATENILSNKPASPETLRNTSKIEAVGVSNGSYISMGKRIGNKNEPHEGTSKGFTDTSIYDTPQSASPTDGEGFFTAQRYSSNFHKDREFSPPESTDSRSRSLNPTKTVSVRDSISFHPLNDTANPTDRSKGRSEVIQIKRNREIPKPFTFKTMKKSIKPEKSPIEESKSTEKTETCTAKVCLSRDVSIDNVTRQISPQKNPTDKSEATRPGTRSGRDARSESSSPRRRIDNIGRLFERHTPGIEYINGNVAANDGQQSPGNSPSPAKRSRKLESQRDFSNNGANYSKTDRTHSSERTDNARNPNNETRSKEQPRSKSDPRGSRSNTARGHR